ncbi:MAG: T9SS type A sorting domain-containing protein, partial [Bacteroidota bacterium]
STDGGASWTKINTGAATGFDVFKDFEVFNGILFAATSNYCLKISLSDLGISSGISDNTIPKNKFSVYPNPSMSAVTVDFGSSTVTPHDVAIYNSVGELVKHLKITSNKSIISISDFPAGNYFFTSSEGTVKIVR